MTIKNNHSPIRHGGLEKWGIPKTRGFNTKMVIHDLDDLGSPPFEETSIGIRIHREIYIYTQYITVII